MFVSFAIKLLFAGTLPDRLKRDVVIETASVDEVCILPPRKRRFPSLPPIPVPLTALSDDLQIYSHNPCEAFVNLKCKVTPRK